MLSRSSSTPSEGEIIESDSEKATTRSVDVRSTSVDRHFRKSAPVSQSPSPIQSPIFHKSRSRSRSPYREPRGAKRSYDDDDGLHARRRNDPRQFKVHFEVKRRARNPYEDLDRSDRSGLKLRYDDRSGSGRPRDKRRRTRSRSPRPLGSAPDHERHSTVDKGVRPGSHSWGDRNGREYQDGRSRLSQKQSVSDWGHSLIATANNKPEAEIPMIQNRSATNPDLKLNVHSAEYVLHCRCLPLLTWYDGRHEIIVSEPRTNEETIQPVDEAALIEERRKRREAIKAKHRSQATSLTVQALAHTTGSATTGVSQIADADQSYATGL